MANTDPPRKPTPPTARVPSQTTTNSRPFDVQTGKQPASAQVELSSRIAHYEIVRKLGEGGMGVVYEAVDTLLNRSVALKCLRPMLENDEESRLRFLREGRAAAQLNHPHVITIYNVGEDNNTPYMAMELLQGEALDDRLQRDVKLSVLDAVRIGRQTAEALSAAHNHNLIHRDIKPANIWLEPFQSSSQSPSPYPSTPETFHVRLLDFGLALEVDVDVRLTQSGFVMGTPAYMSPEQARGEKIDARTDVFSLGCVIYQMLAGTRPFKGDNLGKVMTSLQMDVPVILSLARAATPLALSDLVTRMLAKSVDQRITTMEEVAQQLWEIEKTILETQPRPPALGGAVYAPLPTPPPIVAPPRKSNPIRLMVLLAAFMLVTGWMLAQQFYRGTLSVDCDDPSVELRILNSSGDVVRRGYERTFSLPPGQYTVELANLHPNLTMKTNRAEVQYNQVSTIEIIRSQLP